MNINTFTLGYAFKQPSYKFEDLIRSFHSKANTSGFPTWSLLRTNNNVWRAWHEICITFSFCI